MALERIIDADAHFMEPISMWPKYLEPGYKSIAPRIVTDAKGQKRSLIADQLNFPYDDSYNDTPSSRLEAMDREGIDQMIMYPSLGLAFGGLPDVDNVSALCRAFNNWAYDYRQASPNRLFAAALVPQQSVAETVKETRRAVSELGCKSVFMRPNPIGGRLLDDYAWDPLWNLLEELDTPLVLHEGGAGFHPEFGVERFGRESRFYMHMVCHPFEQMAAMLTLVCGGVLERHPNLRVLFVEAGCAWLPYWMERMDHHWREKNFPCYPLEMYPSEYVKRQCLVSADAEETTVPYVTSAIGPDCVVFSTDFPHPDHNFEGIAKKFRNDPRLSEAAKEKLLYGNAAKFFRL